MASGGAGGGGEPVFEYVDEPLTYYALEREKAETTKYPRMCIKRGKVVRFTGAHLPDYAIGRFEFVPRIAFEYETEMALPGQPGHADWEEAKAYVAEHPDRRSYGAFGEGVAVATAARKSEGMARCLMDTEVKVYDFLKPEVKGEETPKYAIVCLASQVKAGPPYIYANIEEVAPPSEHEGDITPHKGVLRRIIDRSVPPFTPLKVRPAGSPARKPRRKTRRTRRTRRNRRKP